jgi:hypothetical protein
MKKLNTFSHPGDSSSKTTNTDEDEGKRTLVDTTGKQISVTTMDVSTEVLQRTTTQYHTIVLDHFLGIHPTESKSAYIGDTCIPMSVKSLFIIAKLRISVGAHRWMSG